MSSSEPIRPAVQRGNTSQDDISNIHTNIDNYNQLIDQMNANPETKSQVPFYFTGARALLRVGGATVAVANRVRWSIAYNATPIHTIDSVHAWDIDVGQARISVEVGQVIDPTKGPEYDALFAIMAAAIHQPMVELQLLDRQLGTQILYAKGMFTEMSGEVALSQIGRYQLKFVGIAYQQYVNQQFTPYGVAGAAGQLLNSISSTAGALGL